MNLFYKIIIFILIIRTASAQSPLTYYFGLGKSVSSKGNMRLVLLHNELALTINKYISSSIDLQLARSYRGILDKTEYIQGNLNILVAPFGIDKKSYLKVGTGIFYNRMWNYFDPKDYPDYEKNVHTFRLSVFIEDEFKLSKKMLLGLRLFTHPKLSTNQTISGVLVKVGFRL